MLSSSWARGWRAAISPIYVTEDASRMPGASSPDTNVVRIEHVGADDLELGDLVVNGRCADEPLTQALAAARHQRQAHPAIELDRGGRRGHVAETRGARLRRDQLEASAPTSCSRSGAVRPARCDSARPMKSPCFFSIR